MKNSNAHAFDSAHFSHLEQRTAAPKNHMTARHAEEALLQAVREGDLHYASRLKDVEIPTRVRAYVTDPVHNAQIACTIFASLCARAAVDGGLSPDLAYALGDAYIKSFHLTRDMDALRDINHRMYEDFITRVHSSQSKKTYSKAVDSCCHYIRLHIGEAISLADIAERLGYSKYYLSRKFRQETGMTVSAYAKMARMDRARTLLATTDAKIEDIAEDLHFGSRSFFDKTFKETVGQTPAEYRAEHLRL